MGLATDSETHPGSCLCGAVRYTLAGPLPIAYCCHCGDCKKQSASAFSLSMIVARDAVVVEGATASFTTGTPSGAIKSCHFCPACGTRMWNATDRSPDLLSLKVGTLADGGTLTPRAHLWTSQLQPGILLDPDSVQHPTQPDDMAAWRADLAAKVAP